jgi:hypothetical protein
LWEIFQCEGGFARTIGASDHPTSWHSVVSLTLTCFEDRMGAVDRTRVGRFMPLGRGFELEGGFWVDRGLECRWIC